MTSQEFKETKIRNFQALRTQLLKTANFGNRKKSLPIGVPAVDESVGGLFLGAINEFNGSIAGASLFLGKLLDYINTTGAYLALIDASDSFVPKEWTESALGHVLWVRCHSTKEALQATDLLLRDGNFLIVVLDLQMSSTLKGLYSNVWFRFAKVLEGSGVVFLVLSIDPTAQAVQLRLIDESNWTFEALQTPRKDLYAGLQLSVNQRSGILQKQFG